MSKTGRAASAPFAFLSLDVRRQREVARALLAEAEALGRLLASDTAALGREEVELLGRLRRELLAQARALGENARATAEAAMRALEGEDDR